MERPPFHLAIEVDDLAAARAFYGGLLGAREGRSAPTWVDFDHMRWYLIHGKTAIFVDDGTWFLMVFADCEHLDGHNCGAYEKRPNICREYSTDNCEYGDEGVYDKFFETAEQVWEYAEAVLPPRERTAANALGLPVLQGGP